MIVHLHASCWNEERMLPFFFRHYDRLVDHYFIHDHNSTDGSLEILHRHKRVTVLPLQVDDTAFVASIAAEINRIRSNTRQGPKGRQGRGRVL